MNDSAPAVAVDDATGSDVAPDWAWRGNIASYLPEVAAAQPTQWALKKPERYDAFGRRCYAGMTFEQLNRDSDALAYGFEAIGIHRGMPVLLAVKPGLDFISVTFGLFKLGAVPVLVDPGMGLRNALNSIEAVKPEALIGIGLMHAVRKTIGRRALATVRHNVTLGRRMWFWGGHTIERVRELGRNFDKPYPIAETRPDETAAIVFTTGATGPPKGVIYEHGMYIAQVEMLRERFGLGPGDIDLPGFPLFALFSTALGASAVIPDLNASRPGSLDPAKWIEAIRDHAVTYSFGSPTIWHKVTDYCRKHNITLPTLRLVLMAGAPVPPWLFERFPEVCTHSEVEVISPYGATESLPTTVIEMNEVIEETGERTRRGEGYCVGKPLPGVEVRVIRMSDEPIPEYSDSLQVKPNEPGEIAFAGRHVTKEYYGNPQANELAKMRETLPDGSGVRIWHRIGDLGTLDEQGRLWYYGRKAHRVEIHNPAETKVLYSERCEAIFNAHPDVFRAALIRLGHGPQSRPAIVIEPEPGRFPRNSRERFRFREELEKRAKCSPLTQDIRDILFCRRFPTDYRHNAKILREQLADWANKRLRLKPPKSSSG